jgi:hypothetical protein
MESIDGGEAPIGRWRKVVAFVIGLTIAIGGYIVVGSRLPTWRSSANASEVVASSGPATATPALGAGNPDGAQVADRPVPKAEPHKANRPQRRHPPKHRVASRR